MKYVKIIVNHVLVPLFTALFILIVGLCAAGISALIEYCVLREFFKSDYLSLISAPIIALILVVVFEFTKLYLHFLRGRLKKLIETKEISDSPTTTQTKSLLQKCNWILGALVAISFLCTIIFTVTTFRLASYNEDNIQAKIEAINSALSQDIADVENKYNAEYTQKLQPYLNAKETADTALANYDPKGTGPKTNDTIYKNLQAAVDTATKNYKEADNNLSLERDNKISTETDSLRQKANEDIDALSNTDDPNVATKYDNPILSQFLLVIAQTLFHAASYSRSAYLWLTILFSIVLSLMLECIISICFGFISYPLETLADNTINITEKLQRWCNELVLTLLKATCALFICILISFWSTPMNKIQFGSAIISCMISIFLVQNFVTSRHESCNKSSEVRTSLIYTVRDSLLEGIVSFMGYILLGFLLGNEALTLDLPTIAIGIGSTVSGCIGYMPKYLIYNINTNLENP